MQQNAGQAQAMPETEAVPAEKRPGARNERLNVRDFVTIAVLTVLELVVYFSIGMIAGSTPIGWCFTLGVRPGAAHRRGRVGGRGRLRRPWRCECAPQPRIVVSVPRCGGSPSILCRRARVSGILSEV